VRLPDAIVEFTQKGVAELTDLQMELLVHATHVFNVAPAVELHIGVCPEQSLLTVQPVAVVVVPVAIVVVPVAVFM